MGESAENPVDPSINSDAMEIATIILPPYLYDIRDAEIRLKIIVDLRCVISEHLKKELKI